MTRPEGNMIVHKRMSFLSSLVWGICSLLIITILSTVGLVVYVLHVADHKTDGVIAFVREIGADLPAVTRSIPIVADVLNDQRQPDYLKQLQVSVTLASDPHHPQQTVPVMTIQNNGTEMVTFLSMRMVVLNNQNHQPVQDCVSYLATPFAAERDIPGPLMPGATRQIALQDCRTDPGDLQAEYEITDIRTWQRESQPAERATTSLSANINQ
ncbi:MAG: hypothetical protein HJJLKODD_02283 [Phycisphaerae bacterium]|nr:hypothetical protein [Phycisphaerae bacterium]